MPKPQFVSDLRDGTVVGSCFALTGAQKPTGNGPYRFTLRDRTGDIAGVLWPNATHLGWEELRAARYAEVEGLMATSGYTRLPEVTIRAVRIVDAPDDANDYLPCTPHDMEALWKELRNLVSSLSSAPLRDLMKALFKDQAFQKAYRAAPAAQSMHHPYIGGLLEHSLEVAHLCDAVASALPSVNRDLVVVAALLHDMGKTEEIDFGGPSFGPTRVGGMLGHVFLGAQRVFVVMKGISDCPDGLSDALCHLLLSHHGRGEWGAPVGPCVEEAAVLHACDNLSARSYYYRTAKPAGDALFQSVRGLEDRVFVGARPWDEPERELCPAPLSVLRMEPARVRSDLRLVETNPPVWMLPMRGAIAAGIPTDSQETADELFPVPATRAVAEDDYLLRVRGDSMIEAHIEDGDVVVVRPATSARPGEIVAALVDGESTVKYLAEKDGRLVLRPANPRYSDIVPSDELVIQGRVVSVTRNLY